MTATPRTTLASSERARTSSVTGIRQPNGRRGRAAGGGAGGWTGTAAGAGGGRGGGGGPGGGPGGGAGPGGGGRGLFSGSPRGGRSASEGGPRRLGPPSEALRPSRLQVLEHLAQGDEPLAADVLDPQGLEE